MSTRSIVYCEEPGGGWIGTYIHFDGYPEHMLNEVYNISHDSLLKQIRDCTFDGGARSLEGGKLEGYHDQKLNPNPDFTEPDEDDVGWAEYVYRKHLDGSVSYRSVNSATWGLYE